MCNVSGCELWTPDRPEFQSRPHHLLSPMGKVDVNSPLLGSCGPHPSRSRVRRRSGEQERMRMNPTRLRLRGCSEGSFVGGETEAGSSEVISHSRSLSLLLIALGDRISCP